MGSELRELQVGRAGLRVDAEDGARITSLTIDGVEVLGGVGAGVVDHGSFVMAPWAGRIRDGILHMAGGRHALPTDRTHPHAGHGLVMDRPWEVLTESPDRLVLRCDLDGRWPRPGHVCQEMHLTEGQLDQRIEVHANGDGFPAAAGWHPWFRRVVATGAVARLAFRADGMLQRDDRGIPGGEVVPVPPGPWDDCFVGVQWPVSITWPGVLTLRISADTDFAVVYDERAEAFCVEPQTGPPDGPNTSPRLVRARDPLVATMRWTWESAGR